MAIDLYFVGKCKEILTMPNAKEISCGWGIDFYGNLRRPEQWLKTVPIIIDDSIVAKVTDSFLQRLLPYCLYGCILDFERKPTVFHLSLISFLLERKIRPLWIPYNYTKYAIDTPAITVSDLPHNNWKSYCAAQKSLCNNRWVLEYHPLRSYHIPQSQKPIYLDNAICMAHYDNGHTVYYDTSATIMEKINMAEKYGCCGVLTVAKEWHGIK